MSALPPTTPPNPEGRKRLSRIYGGRPGREPAPWRRYKVGRYRLYDRAGKGRARCRSCRRTVRFDHMDRHYRTEIVKWGEARLVERIAGRPYLADRRIRRLGKRTAYLYQIGQKRDEYALARERGEPVPWGWRKADKLVRIEEVNDPDR